MTVQKEQPAGVDAGGVQRWGLEVECRGELWVVCYSRIVVQPYISIVKYSVL